MGINKLDEAEAEEEEWHGITGSEDGKQVNLEPDYERLVNMIEGEDEKEFNGEAVEAPKHADPFQNDQTRHVFQAALDRLDESGQIHLGYGLHPSEWEEDGYLAVGTIRSGRKGSKRLEVALPDSVWRPRSIRWVQGLYLMNLLIDCPSNSLNGSV
jgi:hypothetical protein